GSQLRPHIVWFGEAVPMMDVANTMAEKADIFMVVGTSMAVYPAAGLIDYSPQEIPKYLIDPSDVKINGIANLTIIKEKASIGLPMLLKKLLDKE
ncbi:MAG: Sir2 family NAD-dependent protein deacetylase, partial [Bacteroidia bacterium]